MEEEDEVVGARFYACYLLCSLNPRYKGRHYIGFTVNPRRRIRQHNGELGNGAWRTHSKRPWEMVLCVHGFCTQVEALQFEWAWQHPTRSLAVRDAAACIPASVKGFKKQIHLLFTMLNLDKWCGMDLSLQFLSSKWIAFRKGCPELPGHMGLSIAPVDALPCYLDDGSRWDIEDSDTDVDPEDARGRTRHGHHDDDAAAASATSREEEEQQEQELGDVQMGDGEGLERQFVDVVASERIPIAGSSSSSSSSSSSASVAKVFVQRESSLEERQSLFTTTRGCKNSGSLSRHKQVKKKPGVVEEMEEMPTLNSLPIEMGRMPTLNAFPIKMGRRPTLNALPLEMDRVQTSNALFPPTLGILVQENSTGMSEDVAVVCRQNSGSLLQQQQEAGCCASLLSSLEEVHHHSLPCATSLSSLEEEVHHHHSPPFEFFAKKCYSLQESDPFPVMKKKKQQQALLLKSSQSGGGDLATWMTKSGMEKSPPLHPSEEGMVSLACNSPASTSVSPFQALLDQHHLQQPSSIVRRCLQQQKDGSLSSRAAAARSLPLQELQHNNNLANSNNDTTEVLRAPPRTPPCSQRAVILIPDTPQAMMAREVIDLTDSPF
ncbi:hypothetical protein BDL97_06G133300 [Sphagnum fallax]|nr:hypothetical protein BDL97_06G133300 [Sphagnum fallax]